MEKSTLLVLVVDKLPKLDVKSVLSVQNIFKKSKFKYDFVIIPNKYGEEILYSIEVYLFKTLNTIKKHDGQWRYILSLQGKLFKDDEITFSHFDIPDTNINIMIKNLEKYFNLTIHNECFN